MYATEASLNIYVNGATGDDVNGTGTAGSPYKTIVRAQEDLPRVKQHNCRILIAAGAYTAFPTYPFHELDGGSVAYLGVGAPVPEGITTEMTITGKTNLEGAAVALTVAAAGWTVNSHIGRFLLATSGSHINKAFRIHANTADTIYLPGAIADLPAIGDKFITVVPAVTITPSDPEGHVTVEATGRRVWSTNYGRESVIFSNIAFDFSGCNDAWKQIASNRDVLFTHQFVSMRLPTWGYSFKMEGGKVNYSGVSDETFASATGTGILNLGDGTAAGSCGLSLWRSKALATNVDVNLYDSGGFAEFTVSSGVEASYSNLYRWSAGRAQLDNTMFCFTFINGPGTGSGILGRGMLALGGTSAYIMNVTSAIELDDLSSIDLGSGCCCQKLTTSGYGIQIDAGCTVRINASGAKLLGGGAGADQAVKFTATNPDQTHASWPSAGTAHTEGLGSFVIRSA